MKRRRTLIFLGCVVYLWLFGTMDVQAVSKEKREQEPSLVAKAAVLMDGKKVNKKRLKDLVDTLQLSGRTKHLPNQLSGGQQQRVSIGRALMNAPAIVLADEPTGNLDSKNSQEIMELLKMSNERYGQTLIVITHDENIALQADRVITIEDGKIAYDEVIRR